MKRTVALIAAVLLTSAPWVAPVAADGGYSMHTAAQYVVDPIAGRISVTVAVEFTNTTPDPAGSLSVFDRIDLAVQEGASGATVSDGSGPLTVALAVRDGVTVASVTPRARLRFEEQATFSLSYLLADRSSPDLHVRPEVVEFAAWAFGTAGEVTIDLPLGLTVSSEGDALKVEAGPQRTLLSSGPIVDPARWLVHVTATGRPTFTTSTRRATLAGATLEIELRAWSTDQVWGERVAATILRALPRLEAESGIPYPRVGPLVVVETFSAADATDEGATSSSEIRIAFSASDFTVIHQLAHVWASPTLAAERWLREGIASHLAERVAGALGIDPPYAPSRRAAELVADAFPLEIWGAGRQEPVADAYGYAASWALFNGFAQRLGEAALRSAWIRGAAGVSAYDPGEPGAASSGPPPPPIDSRRMLDLLSEVSGLDMGVLFGEEVFGPAAAPELRSRAAARLAYASLLDLGRGWGAPDAIRTAMAEWAFEDALAQMQDARRWLEDRDRFLLAVDAAGLAPPDRLRQRYLAEGGGPGARAELDAERAVVGAMVAAAERVARPRGIVEQLGLFAGDDGSRLLSDAGASFAGGDLRTASQLIAAVGHRLDGALLDGLLRIGALALFMLVAALALRARPRHGTHYTAAQ